MPNHKKNKTGIIILAAGNSSRLGQPKQLLAYNNTTLLKNTIEQAFKVPNSIIIVVTGSNTELIESDLDFSKIKTCFNSEWESGISTSITKGLKELLLSYQDCESCIFAVCDQPYITNVVFENLIREYQNTEKGIVASSYSETLGTPVLFNEKYYDELLKLEGHEGAKKIINRFIDDTIAVPFEKGNIDIDTMEDYEKLIF
jgi:molybdenum cofactor cytidylyltransferase